MYAAQIVESGPIERVYNAPAHPYTKALLGTILDPLEKKESLTVLTGSIPDSGIFHQAGAASIHAAPW